jgi:hypothetical protein
LVVNDDPAGRTIFSADAAHAAASVESIDADGVPVDRNAGLLCHSLKHQSFQLRFIKDSRVNGLIQPLSFQFDRAHLSSSCPLRCLARRLGVVAWNAEHFLVDVVVAAALPERADVIDWAA